MLTKKRINNKYLCNLIKFFLLFFADAQTAVFNNRLIMAKILQNVPKVKVCL